MKEKNSSSIATKLIFYVLLGNVLISLLFMLHSSFELTKENQQKITDIKNEIKLNIAPSVASSFYNENEELTKIMVKGILRDENIVRITLIDQFEIESYKKGISSNPNLSFDLQKENFKRKMLKIISLKIFF